TEGSSTTSAASHPPNTRSTTTYKPSQTVRSRLTRSSLHETRGGSLRQTVRRRRCLACTSFQRQKTRRRVHRPNRRFQEPTCFAPWLGGSEGVQPLERTVRAAAAGATRAQSGWVSTVTRRVITEKAKTPTRAART